MFYLAAIGFVLCLFALVGLMVQLLRGRPWGLRARAMAFAVAAAAVWSVLGLALVVAPGPGQWAAFRWGDLLRAAAWIGFVLVLLHERQPGDTTQARPGRYIVGASLVMMVSVVVGGLAPPLQHAAEMDFIPAASKVSLVASLCLSILGLVCLEQLLRNVPAAQRWGITPLAIALGGIFAFDLYLYSDAVLFGNLDPVIWSAQGSVSACATPLLAVATARNQKWTLNLAVSHRLVFHSTVLLAAAGYFLGVAALGYLVRFVGGSWGPALQIVLFVAALMVLGALLTLGTLRSKLRVFIHKNLFKQRYDYRQEWLRFTRLIAAREASSDIYVRCINALADLVESPAGSVWIRRGNSYRQVAQWNTPRVSDVEPVDGALVAFLQRTGWVVNLDEYRRAPARYGALQLPGWLAQSTSAWLVVPLVAAEGVVGFAVLMTPRVRVELDWEVLDLLKTAGSQVAALLGQIEANDALSESEKFAAFNRMSAFVVHDLKNLVAQLSLMLKNAQRHGANPDFQHDMLVTVQHVVDRMNGMLAQARLGARPVENPQGVELVAIVKRVCELKSAQRTGLVCHTAEPVAAVGHQDRLEHVLAHVVQNAIDATDAAGHIRVSVHAERANAVIEVVDDGAGMSTAFVQQRLFKPFQTTKETGMGIGVYESHQYVTSLGGQMIVDSTPGAGTRVRIVLPRAVVAGRADNQSFEPV
ncbi:MAG TPA: XrtA/PEP-CTERM system histidine kinase PrsK [Burkholderiaceae bacterium]